MKFYLLLAALLVSTITFSQSIYQYTSAKDGSVSSFSPNATATGLSRVNGSKKASNPCSTGYSSSSFSTATTYNSSEPAIEFSITPNKTYNITAASFIADVRRSTMGTMQVMFAFSTDSGKVWRDEGLSHAPFNGKCGQMATYQWDFVDFPDTGKLMFRIYGYNADKTTGTLQVMNVILNGVVAPIDKDLDGYTIYTEPKDCDDNNPNIHPDAPEICNLLDDNCSGTTDEGTNKYYLASPDGYGHDPENNIFSVCTTAPIGYTDKILPKIDITITDSKIPVVKDLHYFTTVDLNFTGGSKGNTNDYVVRDMNEKQFVGLANDMQHPRFCYNAGSTSDHDYPSSDTLMSGALKDGLNCARDGGEVLQGQCVVKFTYKGTGIDFANQQFNWFHTQKYTNTRTINVQKWNWDTIKLQIQHSWCQRVIFGQEQNLESNKSYYPNGSPDYNKKVDKWIDSTKKYFPNVKTVADAAMIWSTAQRAVKWNRDLTRKADEVDQYFNLTDFAFTGVIKDDTTKMTYLMDIWIPQQLDTLHNLFKHNYISISQYGESVSYHPDDAIVYPNTFFAATYDVRVMNTFFNWNKAHNDTIQYASYSTFKSMIDKNNNVNLNYQYMQPLGQFFTDSSTMLTVTNTRGLLIYGVRTTTGDYKLIALNYSGEDKTLPTNCLIDGYFLPITWTGQFIKSQSLTDIKAATTYLPNGTITGYSEGSTTFVIPSVIGQ